MKQSDSIGGDSTMPLTTEQPGSGFHRVRLESMNSGSFIFVGTLRQVDNRKRSKGVKRCIAETHSSVQENEFKRFLSGKQVRPAVEK